MIRFTSIALRILGLLWVLSWIVIYREIYVWHHMARSFALNPPPVPPGFPPPRPGLFLLSARAISVVAPILFILLLLLHLANVWRSRRRTIASREL